MDKNFGLDSLKPCSNLKLIDNVKLIENILDIRVKKKFFKIIKIDKVCIFQ